MGAVAVKVFRAPPLAPGAGHSEWHIGLIAASIALFGILITGVFVFMTLQINSTAQRTAQQAAGSIARAAVQEAVAEVSPEIVEQAVREAVESAARRTDSLVDPEIDFTDVDDLLVDDDPQEVVLRTNGQRRFRLTVPETARYRIEANAVTEGFDAFLYVFDEELEVVAVDDDGGLIGYDSLLELELQAGIYYVEVEDLVGNAGTCVVSVQLVEP